MKKLIAKLVPSPIKSVAKNALRRKSVCISQAGQDFWVYGEAFNEKRGGFFLDIGAHDGVYISNTYLLEVKYDWNGICVEANPETFAVLQKNRNANCCNACLDSQEGYVEFAKRDVMGGIVSSDTDNSGEEDDSSDIIRLPTTTLVKLLEENKAPAVIDYLSMDIEGAEDRVLSAFDFGKYKFNCITIERPSDDLRNLFQANGYVLIKEIPGLDCFYIHESFKDQYVSNLINFYHKKFARLRWS